MPIYTSSEEQDKALGIGMQAVQIGTNPFSGLPVYMTYRQVETDNGIEYRPVGAIDYTIEGTNFSIGQALVASWHPLGENYMDASTSADVIMRVIDGAASHVVQTINLGDIQTDYYVSRKSSTSVEMELRPIPRINTSGLIRGIDALKEGISKPEQLLDIQNIINKVMSPSSTITIDKDMPRISKSDTASIMLIKTI